ncbi:glycosyltransferase family 4 protein [Vibrio cyclitrophicus]|uniref:glycosyltransferase family 4 protein n=1 Tax=Vibrio cyclitrophicus TaxID=47951 RepID=UPI000C85F00F|nr:glycosyltransferase family 4 protein [Vibrio cyclitrophicus]PMI06553.1 hypothetical protein BCU52_17705 [Vibrio cyclitrophicus]
MEKDKVFIIQPCIPKYRVPLFDALYNKQGMEIFICAAEKDGDGLESDLTGSFPFSTQIKELSILAGKILFQFGVANNEFYRADVIVFPGNPRYLSSWAYYILARCLRKRVVWWGQGWSAGSSKISYLLRRLLMKLFDATILYTEQEAKNLELKKIKPSNVHYLNNGLDLDSIQKVQGCSYNEDSRLDGVLNYKSGPIELIFIGRLTKKSGIEFVIKTLIDSSLDYRLTVVGDGELMDAIGALMLGYSGERIQLLGAIHCEIKLAKIMSDKHYFIYGGAVGLSLIHAYAYGLPAIIHSSLSSHMPEIAAFEENKTGLCFSEYDKCSLLSTVKKAKDMPIAHWREMSIECINKVESDFNINQMAKRFSDCIESL